MRLANDTDLSDKLLAEQITDQEARGFSKSDRDRLVDEAISELFGYGPLEELFADAAVREVMVTGPGTVIARRDLGQWLPTSVKFRDEDQVRTTLDRIATRAEPVGPVMVSITLFDVRLPNGFRAVALIPPNALGQPAMASFLREDTVPVASEDVSEAHANLPAGSSASIAAQKTAPSSATTSLYPGSGVISMALTRTNAGEQTSGTNDPLARHRARILERLLSRFAALKVYDVTRLEVTELRKVITAYIREYVETEKIYLSETDQGRIMLDILTSLTR